MIFDNIAQRNECIFEEYEANKHARGGDRKSNRFKEQHACDDESYDTAKNIAQKYNITRSEVFRAIASAKGLNKADKIVPGIKQKILDNKMYISSNILSKFRNMPDKEIRDIIEEYRQNDKEALKKTREHEHERKLVSNKLRYEILQRDGFKCVLCGASQEDGARLEVDHIVPISKGGKTEPSNLRTLCFICNRGKSDTYTETGMNGA